MIINGGVRRQSRCYPTFGTPEAVGGINTITKGLDKLCSELSVSTNKQNRLLSSIDKIANNKLPVKKRFYFSHDNEDSRLVEVNKDTNTSENLTPNNPRRTNDHEQEGPLDYTLPNRHRALLKRKSSEERDTSSTSSCADDKTSVDFKQSVAKICPELAAGGGTTSGFDFGNFFLTAHNLDNFSGLLAKGTDFVTWARLLSTLPSYAQSEGLIGASSSYLKRTKSDSSTSTNVKLKATTDYSCTFHSSPSLSPRSSPSSISSHPNLSLSSEDNASSSRDSSSKLVIVGDDDDGDGQDEQLRRRYGQKGGDRKKKDTNNIVVSNNYYVINPVTGNKVRKSYKNMTVERRVEANARERNRVHTIGSAFDDLRKLIPSRSCDQKLSKLSILRIACSYILLLAAMNGLDYSADSQGYSVDECVELVAETLATESKYRK